MKYKKLEEHICPYNDGEQICDCFDAGYRIAIINVLEIITLGQGVDGGRKDIIKKINKLIETNK